MNSRVGIHLVLLLALLASPALAQRRPFDPAASKSSTNLREAFAPVVARARASTVIIRCDGKIAALGAIVSADGYILTKASEVDGKITCQLPQGRELPARLVGVSRDHDLAMVKIDAADLTPVKWADAKKVAVGQWVATVSDATLPAAVGVISVGRRRIPPQSGMLGVSLADADGGARIAQVVPESPAEKAGLHVDDLIVRVNSRIIKSREELISTIQTFALGEQVRLGVRRGDRDLDVTATLGSRMPTTASRRAEQMNASAGPLSRRSTGFPAVLQHDTVLKPAECGGPLLDLDGNAIGLNIARAGRTESYAIPADVIESLIPELKTGKLALATTRPAATAPTTRPARRAK